MAPSVLVDTRLRAQLGYIERNLWRADPHDSPNVIVAARHIALVLQTFKNEEKKGCVSSDVLTVKADFVGAWMPPSSRGAIFNPDAMEFHPATQTLQVPKTMPACTL